jgi:hypothetical protein
VIISSSSFEGHRITRNHGIISGEAILKADLFRDLFAVMPDLVDGRSAAHEQERANSHTTAPLVNGFCREVLQALPMEFAMEAQQLVAISLEGSVG